MFNATTARGLGELDSLNLFAVRRAVLTVQVLLHPSPLHIEILSVGIAFCLSLDITVETMNVGGSCPSFTTPDPLNYISDTIIIYN